MGTGAVEILLTASLFDVMFKPSNSEVVSCAPVLILRRVLDPETPLITAVPVPFCGNKVGLS
jgi:hypothetical protein